MSVLGRWVLAGILATLTMDVGSALIRKTGFTAGLQPQVIGRWFASVARGRAIHRSILDTPPVAVELPVALVTHYLIGITLCLALWALTAVVSLRPTAPLAFGFGLLTNLLPWLLMFPAMGFGWFGGSAPPELLLLRTSFVNHAVFGLGLAVSTRLMGVLGA